MLSSSSSASSPPPPPTSSSTSRSSSIPTRSASDNSAESTVFVRSPKKTPTPPLSSWGRPEAIHRWATELSMGRSLRNESLYFGCANGSGGIEAREERGAARRNAKRGSITSYRGTDLGEGQLGPEVSFNLPLSPTVSRPWTRQVGHVVKRAYDA